MIFKITNEKRFWNSFALACVFYNVETPIVAFSKDLPLMAKVDDGFFDSLKENNPNNYERFFGMIDYIE